MGLLLRTKPYACRNYKTVGVGFVYDAAGHPVESVDPADYDDFNIMANIQPLLGKRRKVASPGAETVDKVKLYVGPLADGTFPVLIAGDNAGSLLATRLTYRGRPYEMTVVKDSFTDGFIPHIYAEAELLVHVADPAATDAAGTVDEVQW